MRYSLAVRVLRVSTSPQGSQDSRSVDDGDSRLYSAHTLAAKQPRLKSGGLQSVVSNAGEGLQRADQKR